MQFSLAHIQYIPVSSQDVVLPVPPLVPGHAEDLTQVNENNVQYHTVGKCEVCLWLMLNFTFKMLTFNFLKPCSNFTRGQ